MPAVGADGNGVWLSAVLRGIKAPVTTTNSTALALWADSEAMPTWVNNWLAATEPAPGARDYNGAGVKYYPTVAVGISATVKSLLLPPYSGIVRAFRAGQNLTGLFDAINASPWCAGCDGGRYPLALWGVTRGRGQGGGDAPPRGDAPPEWDWSAKVGVTGGHLSATATAVNAAVRAITSLPT